MKNTTSVELNLEKGLLENSNSVLAKVSKNNQQEFIDKTIAEHKKLEAERGIVRDISNPTYLGFLGGFFEGEGHCSITITIGNAFKYGVNLQPNLGVHQHISGILILNSYLELFKCGSLLLKTGSNDVYGYHIKGYKQIIPNVLPFLQQYVFPYACKTEQFHLFESVLLKLANGEHKNQENLIEMIKLCYLVSGKGMGRKRPLDEILAIVKDKKGYFDNANNSKLLLTSDSELNETI
uniref:LAGLIDADG endonuclease n=1 Tax=Coniophora olivacea TaxID=85977 RepID=A0A896Z9G8_9AGAM